MEMREIFDYTSLMMAVTFIFTSLIEFSSLSLKSIEIIRFYMY